MSTPNKTAIDLTDSTSMFDIAGPNIRPVVRLWEVVFTGSQDETTQRTDEVRALVEASLSDSYRYNGQKSTPADVMDFRALLLKRFARMRTVVTDASAIQIHSVPGIDTAVTLIWHSVAQTSTELVQLNGANLIGSEQLKAVTNTQVGDPTAAWQPVTIG